MSDIRATNSQFNPKLYNKVGAVAGCTGAATGAGGARGDPGVSTHLKIQQTGGGFGREFSNNQSLAAHSGPKGPVASFDPVIREGLSSDTNMGASTQLAYLNPASLKKGGRKNRKHYNKSRKLKGGTKGYSYGVGGVDYYGYAPGADASENLNIFAGSGYPPITRGLNSQCPFSQLDKSMSGGRGKEGHPKKGQASRTRPGRQAFVTHRGDVAFDAGSHRQYRKRRPYAKKYSHPKKGQASRTRRDRKAFITHKGDRAYHARGHRQYRKRRPYTKRRGGGACTSMRCTTDKCCCRGCGARHPRKGQRSLTRRGRLDFITHKGDKDFNARGRRQRRKRRPYTKKRTQRGGYAQYMSDVPYAASYATPIPGETLTGSASALANPVPHLRQVNCQDNYNHYTGKNAPTGVYDQDVQKA